MAAVTSMHGPQRVQAPGLVGRVDLAKGKADRTEVPQLQLEPDSHYRSAPTPATPRSPYRSVVGGHATCPGRGASGLMPRGSAEAGAEAQS